MAPVCLMMFHLIDAMLYDPTSHGKHLTQSRENFLESLKTNYTFTYLGIVPCDRPIFNVFEAPASAY